MIIVISALKKYLCKDDVIHHSKIKYVMKDLGILLVIFFISIVVINTGYLFSGSFTPMGDFHFSSQALKNISTVIHKNLLIPVPSEYLTGL